MEQKNQLHGVLSLFLLVVMVLLIYSVFWGPLADLGQQYPSRTIAVSAVGKTVTKPDIAVISFSVVSEGATTQAVTEDNNAKANKAIAYLKEQGIDEKDIQTTEYNLSPVYTQPVYGPSSATYVPTIAKYTLTQTVQAKIRDFSKVSTVMSGIVSVGVNKLNNVSFTIDDSEKFMAEARQQAFDKVREKAEAMAEEGEFKIGKIVSVNEYGNTPYPMYDKVMSSVEGRGGDSMSAMAVPTLEPGSREVQVNITIVYEIK